MALKMRSQHLNYWDKKEKKEIGENDNREERGGRVNGHPGLSHHTKQD